MKLIVQIPCFNEEKTLPVTIADIPKKIEGIDEIEIVVIDDGSTDRTAEVARELGVKHIIRFNKRKGLAEGFMVGLDACLKLGADIIVNTDGDNQYKGEDIAKLVKPILEKKADMVVGDREINKLERFSTSKKLLQKAGSWVVRQLSGTDIPDTTSGFRAYNRDAVMKLNLLSTFTYTLETIIQAGKKNMAIKHVPIGTNPDLRESRLFSSTWSYIKKSVATIFRIYSIYEPLKVFSYIGGTVFFIGFVLMARFLYFYFFDIRPFGHLQSLILASVLLIIGFMIMIIGLIADLISANRRLIEDALFRIKKIELSIGKDDNNQSKSE